ncbi:hypothetical protein Hypma_012739 [Hypsizygus marmoreus]|uniref:MARVEL domain-containing protein n=1 Tax=Hypsizygus marmoreus TaxID=39966 RepID=A0A369JMG2_HYPMA|nr:hypothetical protein Hypma_012739 [Hypsizygus marmoreus]
MHPTLEKLMPAFKLKLPDAFSKAPKQPLALPRSLLILICLSLLGSCLTLVISMLDLGYLSMWLAPCVAIYTLIFHIGTILIARRPRVPDAPSYFSTAIFCGYLLALIWLVAFILTLLVLMSSQVAYHQVSYLQQHGLPCTVHTQRIQVFLTVYEVVMVGGFAVKGHSIVESEGPDPHNWRYAEHASLDLESVISLYE